MSMPLPSAPPRWPWADTPACIAAATRHRRLPPLQPRWKASIAVSSSNSTRRVFNPGRLYASL
jgi:hypothetical protein